MLKSLPALLLDLLLPPRRTAQALRALTLDDLYNLQTGDGLPYCDEMVRALVWELKYYASPRAAALAGALLAQEVAALGAEEIGVPLLLPVPMHAARRRERGHNQTEVLCETIMKKLTRQKNPKGMFAGATAPEVGKFSAENFPHSRGVAFMQSVEYAPHALVRIIDTPTQQGLERATRLTNVAGSMAAGPAVTNRVCIVIDDVTTTGATFAECRRALKAAGARAVYCVALAYS